MATFRIQAGDGASYRIEADDVGAAMSAFKAANLDMPAPPPGEVVHHAGHDELTGTKLTAARPDDATERQGQVTAETLKARGAGRDLGDTRSLLPVTQGLSFSLGDELIAGAKGATSAATGGSFRDTYDRNKEMLAQELERERAEHPTRALATEIGGGLATAVGAAGAGLTVARALPAATTAAWRVASTVGASAADGGLYGAVSGFGSGDGMADSLEKGAKGAAVGTALGAGLPVVGAAVGKVVSPVTNAVMSRVAPEGFANSKLMQVYQRAGMTPAEASAALDAARADGQGMFTLADALGNAGQRSLSGVARIPHNERAALVEALENRQAGQGRRVSNALAEGFDAPQTAAQTRARLTGERDAASDLNYGAVRDDAGPVDLSRAIARIDATVRPGVNAIARPASGIADDSVEAALSGVRSRLTDGRSVLTEFQAVQRARGDLADQIETAQRAGQGNKARLLRGVRDEIDAAMERASPGFRAANAEHAARSRAIDAVDLGTQAAQRGRIEDTIPAFRAMPANQQAAFRTGYVDPHIATAQGAAIGVNKARPLLNDAFAHESAAMAPMRTGPQMARRIGRENTMFETRNAALGGSRTADNLADSADLHAADPAILANLLSGHFVGAARHAGARVMANASGMSPGVAERMARALMETDAGAAGARAATAARSVERSAHRRQMVARALLGGAASQEH